MITWKLQRNTKFQNQMPEIFINRRANITLLQMRKIAKDVNPEEFFIPADETIDDKFYSEQGDIVLHSGKKLLVLSKYEVNKKYNFFVGIELVENVVEGVKVSGNDRDWYGLLQTVTSCPYNRKCPVFVDKILSDDFGKILTKLNLFF